MTGSIDTARENGSRTGRATPERSDRIQKDRADDEGMLTATDPDEGHSAVVAPGRKTPRAASSRATPEETDLERRVLAHERILQTLIAHLAETEPAFLERLHQSFVESMRMVSHEQDYTDTDDYAEEFIRTVTRVREKPRRGHDASRAPASPRTVGSGKVAPGSPPFARSPVFQLRERSGAWEVTVDGSFHGRYSRPAAALEVIRALSTEEA